MQTSEDTDHPQIHYRRADGPYDTLRCHTAIIDRQATPIIPIRNNGRSWKDEYPAAIARNETLRATQHYGRAFWKRSTGYRVRSRIKAKTQCLRAFGERIAARDLARQTAEIQIRIALINRFSALGTAKIVRVEVMTTGKGGIMFQAVVTASTPIIGPDNFPKAGGTGYVLIQNGQYFTPVHDAIKPFNQIIIIVFMR